MIILFNHLHSYLNSVGFEFLLLDGRHMRKK